MNSREISNTGVLITPQPHGLDQLKQKAIGNAIAAYMKARKLNQSALATQLGVSQSTISGWLNGNYPLDQGVTKIQKIMSETSAFNDRRVCIEIGAYGRGAFCSMTSEFGINSVTFLVDGEKVERDEYLSQVNKEMDGRELPWADEFDLADFHVVNGIVQEGA